jgi:hypothetical protein
MMSENENGPALHEQPGPRPPTKGVDDMSKLHASKKSRHPKTTTKISIIPECFFCGSYRFRFYECTDDRGYYVAVKCDRCEAEGPHVRGPIGDDDRVTARMKMEAARAWSSSWSNIAEPPDEVLIEVDGDLDVGKPAAAVVRPRRRAPAKFPAVGPTAPQHQIHQVAPAHNGHNGTSGHQNATVL